MSFGGAKPTQINGQTEVVNDSSKGTAYVITTYKLTFMDVYLSQILGAACIRNSISILFTYLDTSYDTNNEWRLQLAINVTNV